MLNTFFNPQSIAVVGISKEPTKLSALVFKNILDAGYTGKLYGVNPRYAGETVYDKPCVASVRDITHPVDLVVVLVPAAYTMPVIDDAIANKTKNISIITAGFGEVGNHDLEDEIARKCIENGINLLGPNCLGHISTFNHLNASFADGFPKTGNVAFISQSGAYCSAIMDWAKEKGIGFSHFISIGNKALLAEDTLLNALKNDPETTAFVFYLESLKNGKEFLKVIKEVSKTKPVVIMEPGKSQKAQAASLSHTGSLAPNYRVLEMALKKSGAIQAYNTRELFGLLEVLQFCKNNEFDTPLAILTNAGGVGVLTSDLCEENNIDLKKPSDKTIAELKGVLSAEAAFGNPIDVVGDAKAKRYEDALDILCASGEYKNVLVLLTPQISTDVKGTAEAIIRVAAKYPHINIFSSFIGGTNVGVGVKMLKEAKMLAYEYPVDIVRLLGLLKEQMKYRGQKAAEAPKAKVSAEIVDNVSQAVAAGLASLPQDVVTQIMDHYGLDYPKSGNFTDKTAALDFCKKFFPNPVVLKLSAPDALHKTEMKGVYLNINDGISFEAAWTGLQDSINRFNLKGASVLIQEMITNSESVIIGVNADQNFGRVMVFGTGGVYTEIMQDTTLRILPADDFDAMISETKIGTILKGVRGIEPKAIKPLIDTLEKVQQVVLDIPQIMSIDANPVLVTKDRAVAVDFKMILKS
ncbi:MAG: acetate--CoA ligase family protein [Lactobacillales bacterium]|jgi:acetyltransferase|nr:acetate--CoA ligase family protein [Lactobacillales bacterium]